MRKAIVGLVLALALLAALVAPALAQTPQPITASVNVNAFISFTIVDRNSDGINFTDANPKTTVGDAAQNAVDSSVTVTLAPETNVPCRVQVAASRNFSGTGGTIAATNAQVAMDSGGSAKQQITVSPTYLTITTANAGETVNLWHWLIIPENTPAGRYTTDFLYRVGP